MRRKGGGKLGRISQGIEAKKRDLEEAERKAQQVESKIHVVEAIERSDLMWSPSIEILNPYTATVESVAKELEKKEEKND